MSKCSAIGCGFETARRSDLGGWFVVLLGLLGSDRVDPVKNKAADF
jgi:hypothetical protein